MTQECFSAGCVSAGRVALVDACTGEFSTDPNTQYVFGGITAVTWEPQIEDGETTTVKDMCGNICVRDLQCDQTVGYNVEITLCRPDNELVSLLTGEPAILDGSGNTIGYFQLDDSNCAPFVSLELFEKLPESQCSAGVQYRRIIFPKIRITQGTPERQGPIRLLKLQGTAESGSGDGWATGPAGDSPVDYAALMTAGQKFYMSEVYDDTAPDPACGYTVTGPVAPVFVDATSSAPCTVELNGTFAGTDAVGVTFNTFGLFYIYNPTSPNVGLNPPGLVINYWNNTGISFTLPDICGDCLNQIDPYYYDVGTASEVAFGAPIPISPCTTVLGIPQLLTFDTAGNCGGTWDFIVAGTYLDEIGKLTLGLNTAADPFGPQNQSRSFFKPGSLAETNLGPNPAGVTVFAWNATTINIEIDFSIYPYDASFAPYGIVDIFGFNDAGVTLIAGPVDVFTDPCFGVQAVSVDSSAASTWRMQGEGFTVVDKLTIQGSFATQTFYDPSGPNNGLNPGGATILSWTDTLIEILDATSMPSGSTSQAIIDMQDVSAQPIGLIWDYPDFLIL
jgi:hypothetical protein